MFEMKVTVNEKILKVNYIWIINKQFILCFKSIIVNNKYLFFKKYLQF